MYSSVAEKKGAGKKPLPKEELVKEILLRSFDMPAYYPNEKNIDGIIDEARLHEFSDEDVLDVAQRFGFLISACMGYAEDKKVYPHQAYKANGVWVEPSRALAEKLKRSSFGTFSHGLCPNCFEKYREYMKNQKV